MTTIRNRIVLKVVACLVLLVGCQRATSPGGDSPITTQRLAGSRLTDIRDELSWTFRDTGVVIENNGQPLPSDLIRELLGSQSAPKRIEATWRFDEKVNILRLSNVKADGENISTELPLSPRLLDELRGCWKQYKPASLLFPGNSADKTYADTSIQKAIKASALAANINKNVTPHTLRHSYATGLPMTGCAGDYFPAAVEIGC